MNAVRSAGNNFPQLDKCKLRFSSAQLQGFWARGQLPEPGFYWRLDKAVPSTA